MRYLVDGLFDFPEPNVQVHLLLLQLASLLMEQVGIVVDEVQVVARRDGHCPAPSLCQPSIGLLEDTGQSGLVTLLQRAAPGTEWSLAASLAASH